MGHVPGRGCGLSAGLKCRGKECPEFRSSYPIVIVSPTLRLQMRARVTSSYFPPQSTLASPSARWTPRVSGGDQATANADRLHGRDLSGPGSGPQGGTAVVGPDRSSDGDTAHHRVCGLGAIPLRIAESASTLRPYPRRSVVRSLAQQSMGYAL